MSLQSQLVHEPLEGDALAAGEQRRPHRTAQTVSGYLSALAIFTSVVGIAWHPLRLILPSLAIALVSAGMARRDGRLQLAAVLICGVCFFLGLTVAVATSSPLW